MQSLQFDDKAYRCIDFRHADLFLHHQSNFLLHDASFDKTWVYK